MRIIASLVALALFFAAPARAEMEQAKVALPSPIISFAAEYIAEAMFFKDQGLGVQSQLLPGIASINSVISGSMNFAFATGSSLTRAAAHGQRLLAIATLSTEPGEFLALRKDIADAARFDPKAPLAERAQLLKAIPSASAASARSAMRSCASSPRPAASIPRTSSSPACSRPTCSRR
jgi:NitT/TauT family transport system substrate-binding protein